MQKHKYIHYYQNTKYYIIKNTAKEQEEEQESKTHLSFEGDYGSFIWKWEQKLEWHMREKGIEQPELKMNLVLLWDLWRSLPT